MTNRLGSGNRGARTSSLTISALFVCVCVFLVAWRHMVIISISGRRSDRPAGRKRNWQMLQFEKRKRHTEGGGGTKDEWREVWPCRRDTNFILKRHKHTHTHLSVSQWAVQLDTATALLAISIQSDSNLTSQSHGLTGFVRVRFTFIPHSDVSY